MANFECNPGYKLQGTRPLICLETGEWDGPTDPTCVLDVASKHKISKLESFL